jgi:hypothetical protein
MGDNSAAPKAMTADILSFQTARRLRSLPPPRLNLRIGDRVRLLNSGREGPICGVLGRSDARGTAYRVLTDAGFIVATEASVERL